jgi:hypothetical protein
MECEAFIKSILNQVLNDYSLKQKKEKKEKAKRGKKVIKQIPVHNHPLSTEIHLMCPLCQSHGNVMALIESEYEIF